MKWARCPTLYYGDEAGVCGWTDPDNRRTYPWGNEDLELIEFHRYMTGIRRRNPALRTGSLTELLEEPGMIAYGRFQAAGKETKESRVVVAVNTCQDVRIFRIPVWKIGITDFEKMRRVMLTYEEGYNAGVVDYEVGGGILEIEIPPSGSAVLAAEMA